MFAGQRLPRKLQRAVQTLSTTVQVLLSEIVLAVEGYEAEPNRKAQTEYETVIKNKKATEQINEQLGSWLASTVPRAEDVAIAVATTAGRSTAQIAEFYGIDQLYAMRRLCSIRKQADKYRPRGRRSRVTQFIQLCFDFVRDEYNSDVLEEFAEAARR